MEVNETQGIDALIKVLSLAEEFKRFELMREVLLFLQEGGARVQRLEAGHWLVEYHPTTH